MAEEIRLAVMNNPYVIEDSGQALPLSVSIGVTQHHSGESETELFGRVDKALYQAKQAGRNRIEVI